MAAQELNMDVLANNLANVNTTGFKKSRVDFQDLIYQTLRSAGTAEAEGAQVPTGIQVGLGTHPAAVQKFFTQGDLQMTSNALDVAIEGPGFLQILMPDGTTAYTRDGSLKMDSQGRLVTSDGYAIDPEITVPAEATGVAIGSDGTVSALLPGQSQPQPLGQIQLAKFLNPAGLMALGRNLFKPTAASGEATPGTAGLEGLGTLRPGALEMSNVSIVDEMVNMIVAQRAYETNSKSIQASDQMLSIANGLLR
jgi:flagellar basal-body rod protein FlgG